MGVSLKDFKRAAKFTVGSFEAHQEQESLARVPSFVDRYCQTQGAWVFLCLGTVVSMLLSVSTFISGVFNVGASTGVPLIFGAIAAVILWRAEFTKKRFRLFLVS